MADNTKCLGAQSPPCPQTTEPTTLTVNNTRYRRKDGYGTGVYDRSRGKIEPVTPKVLSTQRLVRGLHIALQQVERINLGRSRIIQDVNTIERAGELLTH